MSIADRFVNQTLGFWNLAYDRGMTRWREATQRIEDREYGVNDVISDAFGYWNEVANGWMAVLNSAQQRVPIVYLHIDPYDQAAGEEIDCYLPAVPKGEPTLAFLTPQQDGGDERISKATCKVSFARDRNCLRIHFDGLRTEKDKDPPLREGTYHGLVHCDDVPLAVLYVRVGPGAGEQAVRSAPAPTE